MDCVFAFCPKHNTNHQSLTTFSPILLLSAWLPEEQRTEFLSWT